MPGFVIEFNRKTRARRVREFETAREAMDYRLELERDRADGDVEIAALTSRSLESLERTHSRYFTGEDLDEQATCV
ncbi:hypothetical protein [Gordonia sp. NPDC003585]|uniref:hypothetical protein n=1 Tax=Gordonia sp. NPDC003585 TaxID=3154275 RepID=UPI0033BA2A2E